MAVTIADLVPENVICTDAAPHTGQVQCEAVVIVPEEFEPAEGPVAVTIEYPIWGNSGDPVIQSSEFLGTDRCHSRVAYRGIDPDFPAGAHQRYWRDQWLGGGVGRRHGLCCTWLNH